MEAKNITLTTEAIAAIERLQHINGTYNFYEMTLSRLFGFILDQSDEIGMSDTEAISTLRALRYIREDLAAIAGRSKTSAAANSDEENAAGKVESAFSGFNITEGENDFRELSHMAADTEPEADDSGAEEESPDNEEERRLL